jgi:hypothetical protein
MGVDVRRKEDGGFGGTMRHPVSRRKKAGDTGDGE